jgi:hypothetical protein
MKCEPFTKHKEWLITYFVFALDCAFPLLEALFVVHRSLERVVVELFFRRTLYASLDKSTWKRNANGHWLRDNVHELQEQPPHVRLFGDNRWGAVCKFEATLLTPFYWQCRLYLLKHAQEDFCIDCSSPPTGCVRLSYWDYCSIIRRYVEHFMERINTPPSLFDRVALSVVEDENTMRQRLTRLFGETRASEMMEPTKRQKL